MRLIDADALPRHGNRGGLVHWKDIENAPTIEPKQADDLISRADAIEAIARLHALNDEKEIRRAYRANPHSTMTDFEDTLVSAFDAIYDIPSAQPKRGEWIVKQSGFAECSVCEQHYFSDYNYCPNCGARMTDSEKPNNCEPQTERSE